MKNYNSNRRKPDLLKLNTLVFGLIVLIFALLCYQVGHEVAQGLAQSQTNAAESIPVPEAPPNPPTSASDALVTPTNPVPSPTPLPASQPVIAPTNTRGTTVVKPPVATTAPPPPAKPTKAPAQVKAPVAKPTAKPKPITGGS